MYAVDAKLIAGMIVYTVHAGDEMVARAVFDPMRGAVTDVLVYRETDRRRGIASSLYDLIEQDIGRPLRPSRIRSYAGRAFWARRRHRDGLTGTEERTYSDDLPANWPESHLRGRRP